MWESRSRMISWPWRVWARTETRLPWVPEETNRAASLPMRRAACSSSRRTVGSSSHTSSPTSAWAMASRISGVGSVNVSERKSTMSCIERLPRGGGLEPLRCPAAPFGIGVFRRNSTKRLLRVLRSPVHGVHLAETIQRFRNHESARIVLDDVFEPLTGRRWVAVAEVVARDPQFLLREPSPADVDLGQRDSGVATFRVLPNELPERFHGLRRDRLILLDGLHLVVVAHGQAVLHEVGDLMARIEGQEDLELLDGLFPFALAVVRLADQEAGAWCVRGLGVTLDDLLEGRLGLAVAAPVQFHLTLRIQIRSRHERLGLWLEEIADGGTPSEYEDYRCKRQGKREELTTRPQVVRFQSR